MMIEDKILLTARYVEGDLSETERVDFELRLQHDVELQAQLKTYHHAHQSLKMQLANDAADEQFKTTLKELNKRYFTAEPKVISFKPYFKWVSGVAAVLIVGLLIWAPWRSNLYQDYVGDRQMLVTERGANELTELDQAAANFNQKNYPAAKLLLQKLYAQQPDHAIIGYYYGLSLIETNELTKARNILTEIYKGESIFRFDAAYGIALSYLKEDKKADCKNWLQKIPAGTTHYKKAIELMGKL